MLFTVPLVDVGALPTPKDPRTTNIQPPSPMETYGPVLQSIRVASELAADHDHARHHTGEPVVVNSTAHMVVLSK